MSDQNRTCRKKRNQMGEKKMLALKIKGFLEDEEGMGFLSFNLYSTEAAYLRWAEQEF